MTHMTSEFDASDLGVLYHVGTCANIGYTLFHELPRLRHKRNIVDPFVCTTLEACRSRNSHFDDLTSSEEPSDMDFWGVLASSLAIRLAEQRKILTICWDDKAWLEEREPSLFWDTCRRVHFYRRSIPYQLLEALVISLLRWFVSGDPRSFEQHHRICLSESPPVNVPAFHEHAILLLCPLPEFSEELTARAKSPGVGSFSQDDYRKCEFILISLFEQAHFEDGAGITIIHRPELSAKVKQTAQSICAKTGLDWQEDTQAPSANPSTRA